MRPDKKAIVMENSESFVGLHQKSDMALLRDIFQGSNVAFDELLDRYVPLVSRNTFRILCDRTDSEAVTRQVFIWFRQNLSLYDDRYSLEEWLLRRTFLFSRRRFFRRRMLRVAGQRPPLFAVSRPKVENMDDYITTQAWEMFCRASGKMTPIQRIVFTFVDLEGIDDGKTAFFTGLFGHRVAIARERARKRIKEELEVFGKTDEYDAYIGFIRKVSESLTDLEMIKKDIRSAF